MYIDVLGLLILFGVGGELTIQIRQYHLKNLLNPSKHTAHLSTPHGMHHFKKSSSGGSEQAHM